MRARGGACAAGFSLAELLAVLAVASIALAVAAPNLRELLRVFEIKSAVHDLSGAIALTRSQAIARNAQVKIAPRDPPGANWALGWTVFVDSDGDRRPGADEEIIAVHGPLADGVAAHFAFTSPAPPNYIAYNGAGRSCSDTNSATARFGTLSLFYGEQTRRIKINMLGRARVCNPARENGCEGAPGPP
jgi:type IV fimbrial biogenesis protein FimT